MPPRSSSRSRASKSDGNSPAKRGRSRSASRGRDTPSSRRSAPTKRSASRGRSPARTRASPAKASNKSRKQQRDESDSESSDDENVGKASSSSSSKSPARGGAKSGSSGPRRRIASPGRPKQRSKASAADSDSESEEDEVIRGDRNVGGAVYHPKTPPPPSPSRSRGRRRSPSPSSEDDHEVKPVASPVADASPSSGIFTRLAKVIPFASAQSLYIASVITFYSVTSMATVIANKLQTDKSNNKFVITLTAIQLLLGFFLGLFGSLIAQPLARISPIFSPLVTLFPPFRLSRALLLRLLPTTIAFTFMLVLTNQSIANVDIAFYPVARAWTVFCSMVISFALFGIRPSFKEILCCFIIAAGYMIACVGTGFDTNTFVTDISAHVKGCTSALSSTASTLTTSSKPFSTRLASFVPSLTSSLLTCVVPTGRTKGLAYGFLASIALALYSILLNANVRKYKLDANLAGSAVNLWGAIFVTILAFVSGEVTQGTNSTSSPIATAISNVTSLFTDKALLAYILIGALVGFLVSIASTLQIKATSGLTHNVTGTAKAAIQSVIGGRLRNETVTLLGWVGLVLTLTGCSLFAYVRSANQQQSQQQQQQQKKKKDDQEEESGELTDPEWFTKINRLVYRFLNKPPQIDE